MKSISVLMISSIFVLVLVISLLLIFSTNTSLAFSGQQQQNASQSNQSLLQLSPQQLPTTGQQQQISLEELKDSEDFIASGIMDSTIYTINGNWKAIGNWKLTVSEGELTSFDTDMAWNNGTAAHTHEFQNFEANEDNIKID